MTYINDNSRPLIFLGSSESILKFIECCEDLNINVAGIIDGDYFGNTESMEGIPIIDGHDAFSTEDKIAYYKNNFNFFCAVNWIATRDAGTRRNKEKRQSIISQIQKHNLPLITIVHPKATVSRYSSIGQGCYIGICLIEPHVTIHDFATVWDSGIIGHHSELGFNSVLQRSSVMAGRIYVKDNVYIGYYSLLGKANMVVESGAWIQPGILVFRSVSQNEIVLNHNNQDKIYTKGTLAE